MPYDKVTQTASGVRHPASLWVCSFLHSHRYFLNLTRLFPRFLSFSPNQNISLQFTFYTDTRPAFQRVDSHSPACQGFIALAARETGLLQAWRPPSLASSRCSRALCVPCSPPESAHSLTSLHAALRLSGSLCLQGPCSTHPSKRGAAIATSPLLFSAKPTERQYYSLLGDTALPSAYVYLLARCQNGEITPETLTWSPALNP